jgi:hypothetical protein
MVLTALCCLDRCTCRSGSPGDLLGYAGHADPVLRGHVATLAGGVVHGVLSADSLSARAGVGM